MSATNLAKIVNVSLHDKGNSKITRRNNTISKYLSIIMMIIIGSGNIHEYYTEGKFPGKIDILLWALLIIGYKNN